jgi:hypothetical protein
VDVVGVAGGTLLVLMLMFEAPHSLHTHIRSSLYIYDAIQHLLQWLLVLKVCNIILISAMGEWK